MGGINEKQEFPAPGADKCLTAYCLDLWHVHLFPWCKWFLCGWLSGDWYDVPGCGTVKRYSLGSHTPMNPVIPIPEAGFSSPESSLVSCSLSPGFPGFISVAGQGVEGGREMRHSYFLLCPVLGRSKASLPGPTSSRSSSRLMSKFIFLMSQNKTRQNKTSGTPISTVQGSALRWIRTGLDACDGVLGFFNTLPPHK